MPSGPELLFIGRQPRTNTNPNWSGRKYLSDATGFDFHSMQGCTAARQLAVDLVGREPVKLLDRATLGCDVADLDLSPIEETLKQVWRAWCEHGAGKASELVSIVG